MINRAYSILTIKSGDEDKRIIKGTATTPTPDRALRMLGSWRLLRGTAQ